MDKVLIFEISSKYGQFKKPFSTVSKLTFSIPTPTALMGIMAAILGYERDSYYDKFANYEYAVEIVNPIRKVNIGINLWQTKTGKEKNNSRTQVGHEFLKAPSFRIYLKPEDEDDKLIKRLSKKLAKSKSEFTPYMGVAFCLANINYLGIKKVKKIKKREAEVSSVVDSSRFEVSEINEDLIYYTETVSRMMNMQREVLEYTKLIFEKNGNKLPIRRKKKEADIYEINDKFLTFF